MHLGLIGKRAMVTGASKGIGAAVAKLLAAEGCNLVLVARDQSKLEALKRELLVHDATLSIELLPMDMRAPDACRAIARAAGQVDILVNNAGDVPAGGVLDVDESTWRRAWDLKIFGYINLTREVYGKMIASSGGVIVNIIGTAGERPRGNHICVASGNAALIAFTRALGMESPKHGVRVMAVNPGATETDRQITRWKARAVSRFNDAERWRELVTEYPFGRLAHPDEVASVVVFMASERASYVSGTTIAVDAGGDY